MHKDTQAMMIGVIASVAFSLAAPMTAEARLPPMFYGNWCQTAGHLTRKFELCPPNQTSWVISENGVTIHHETPGDDTVCKEVNKFSQHDGKMWNVHYKCTRGNKTYFDSLRLWRGKEETPTLIIENSPFHRDFTRARENSERYDNVWKQPAPTRPVTTPSNVTEAPPKQAPPPPKAPMPSGDRAPYTAPTTTLFQKP